jgi:hypothetical protein
MFEGINTSYSWLRIAQFPNGNATVNLPAKRAYIDCSIA